MSAPTWLRLSEALHTAQYGLESHILQAHLIVAACEAKGTCWSHYPAGNFVADISDVISELQELGFWMVHHDDCNDEYLFVNETGFVEIQQARPIPISVCTLDRQELERLRDHIARWVEIAEKDAAGNVYMLQAGERGLGFLPMGNAGRPVHRANYARGVIDAFDHVVEDFRTKDPCGRLVLFSGPPGTGKTHLVRGLLAASDRPRFIVVSAGDVANLLAATTLSALCMFSRKEAKGRPIVLVVEDADVCLLPRATDNLSIISALLNMTDGLVASALDLRLVVTTNARQIEVDPALLRPGRVCRRIEVPALEPAEAQRVLTEILGRMPRFEFRKPATLADVYAKAREEEPETAKQIEAA